MPTIQKEERVQNVPEKKFSSGPLSATVWENQGKNQTGEPVAYKTVSFQRSYKDQNGEWKTTNSLRINDLPRARVILGKAYEYLILKDQGTEV